MHGRSNPHRRVMISFVGKDTVRDSPGSQGVRTSVAVTPGESDLLLSQAIDTHCVICCKHWCLSLTTGQPCEGSSIGGLLLEGQAQVWWACERRGLSSWPGRRRDQGMRWGMQTTPVLFEKL
jgi:hypothetical protein